MLTLNNLLNSFIPFPEAMQRFVIFIITWALVAAVPRDNRAQVSECPSFLSTLLGF